MKASPEPGERGDTLLKWEIRKCVHMHSHRSGTRHDTPG